MYMKPAFNVNFKCRPNISCEWCVKIFKIFICRFCLVIFKNADKSNSVNTISKPQNLFLTSPVKINTDKLDWISIICGEYS